MICLRSFIIRSSANDSLSGADIATWNLGGEHYWNAKLPAGSSTFSVQGFKLINIYSIEVQGIVESIFNIGQSVIINDWQFLIRVNGQNQLVSGLIYPTLVTPNFYSILTQPENPEFNLSKYSPKFELSSPIQSVTSIEILGLQASGYGAESLTNINLSWAVNFIVKYNYEGE